MIKKTAEQAGFFYLKSFKQKALKIRTSCRKSHPTPFGKAYHCKTLVRWTTRQAENIIT
jgi:hypothetical protein